MNPTAADVAEMTAKLDVLIKVVGEESEDGKSGTGLFGEVRRTSEELRSMKSLRDRGVGMLILLGLIGTIFGSATRDWIDHTLHIGGPK